MLVPCGDVVAEDMLQNSVPSYFLLCCMLVALFSC